MNKYRIALILKVYSNINLIIVNLSDLTYLPEERLGVDPVTLLVCGPL